MIFRNNNQPPLHTHIHTKLIEKEISFVIFRGEKWDRAGVGGIGGRWLKATNLQLMLSKY